MTRQLPELRNPRRAGELAYANPPDPVDAYGPTLTAIRSTWADRAVVDAHGQVWVDVAGLHVILRTSRENARHFVREDVPYGERAEIGGTLLVRGWRVATFLDREIQRTGRVRRARYLRNSEAHYRGVRDAAEAALCRVERSQQIDSLTKRLKKLRIEQHGLTHDELTGELLEDAAHFAHVLARTVYPSFSDCVWNGVVVNPATHDRMTADGVVDLDGLLAHCRTHGLATGWLPAFRAALGSTRVDTFVGDNGLGR